MRRQCTGQHSVSCRGAALIQQVFGCTCDGKVHCDREASALVRTKDTSTESSRARTHAASMYGVQHIAIFLREMFRSTGCRCRCENWQVRMGFIAKGLRKYRIRHICILVDYRERIIVVVAAVVVVGRSRVC